MKYINIYQDKAGKFISDREYDTFEEAFENRDDLDSYRETVGITNPERDRTIPHSDNDSARNATQ